MGLHEDIAGRLADVRERLATGRPVGHLLTRAVLREIDERGLYPAVPPP